MLRGKASQKFYCVIIYLTNENRPNCLNPVKIYLTDFLARMSDREIQISSDYDQYEKCASNETQPGT